MDNFTWAIHFFLGVCAFAGLVVFREQLRATGLRRAVRVPVERLLPRE